MKTLIYMDLCCFNRPFDDQHSPSIYLETEAKLFVQDAIKNGELDVCWSYMLSYENSANPDKERRKAIQYWRDLSQVIILENERILAQATTLNAQGFGAKDALHIACAVEGKAGYFLTTDKGILRKKQYVAELIICNPTEFFSLIQEKP